MPDGQALLQFPLIHNSVVFTVPATSSFTVGADVPIPTFPWMIAPQRGDDVQPYQTVRPALLQRKLLVHKLLAFQVRTQVESIIYIHPP